MNFERVTPLYVAEDDPHYSWVVITQNWFRAREFERFATPAQLAGYYDAAERADFLGLFGDDALRLGLTHEGDNDDLGVVQVTPSAAQRLLSLTSPLSEQEPPVTLKKRGLKDMEHMMSVEEVGRLMDDMDRGVLVEEKDEGEDEEMLEPTFTFAPGPNKAAARELAALQKPLPTAGCQPWETPRSHRSPDDVGAAGARLVGQGDARPSQLREGKVLSKVLKA